MGEELTLDDVLYDPDGKFRRRLEARLWDGWGRVPLPPVPDRELAREDMLRLANRTGKAGVVFFPPDGSWPRASDVAHGFILADEAEAEGPEGE